MEKAYAYGKYDPTSIAPLALTGASQEIWPSNPSRRAIILFIPSGITLWLSYANPAVIGQGIPLSNQTYPYIFDCDRFGDMPTRTVFGISTGVTNGGILEVFDREPLPDISALANRGADLHSWGATGG